MDSKDININDFDKCELTKTDTRYYFSLSSDTLNLKYYELLKNDEYLSLKYHENLGSCLKIVVDINTAKIWDVDFEFTAPIEGDVTTVESISLSLDSKKDVENVIKACAKVEPALMPFFEKMKVINMNEADQAIVFSNIAMEEFNEILSDCNVDTKDAIYELIGLYNAGDIAKYYVDHTLMAITQCSLKEILERVSNKIVYEKVTCAPKSEDELHALAYSLAVELDVFAYGLDLYEYNDTVDNREAHMTELLNDIENGNNQAIKNTLKELIDEAACMPEDLEHARNLLIKLTNYENYADSLCKDSQQAIISIRRGR